jgi:hypothetical protein
MERNPQQQQQGAPPYSLVLMAYCLFPYLRRTPPLWKSSRILHCFLRKAPDINKLIFLSVNYPVNFNPEKTPLFSPKGPAWGAKRPHFRPFVAPRLRPLDKSCPPAHLCRARGVTVPPLFIFENP